ncbi:MAG: TetR/AcrR family transcriptional regulator [Pararhodobacter sp.]|nr:TetR/AcrR family transcriptional regulator [Pararhodobacter sp.]
MATSNSAAEPQSGQSTPDTSMVVRDAQPPLPDAIRDRLCPVVFELFTEKDFHQVNLREIYQRSGVSPSTIYRYFDTKEELVFSLLTEKIQEIAEIIREQTRGIESSRELMRRIFWLTLDYYDRNPGVAVTAFITIPLRSWMRSGAYTRHNASRIIYDLREYGVARGEIDPAVSAADIADQYFMYCYRQIHKWYFRGMKRKLVDELDQFFPLVWKTIAK